MWIIVLKSILALVSIFTGGAIFYKYIKDNKILVFLAGSVSILSAVYLFNEVGRDIDKLIVEKKVEAKVESKKEAVVEGGDESQSSSSSSGKWITPSNSVCKSNGGKVDSDGCEATWSDAKKICSASGGRLPTIDELKKVVTDCGGEMKYGNVAEWKRNSNNSSYQSCYKEKGFSRGWYWSKTSKNSSQAWYVYFRHGSDYWHYKTYTSYVLCVSGQ